MLLVLVVLARGTDLPGCGSNDIVFGTHRYNFAVLATTVASRFLHAEEPQGPSGRPQDAYINLCGGRVARLRAAKFTTPLVVPDCATPTSSCLDTQLAGSDRYKALGNLSWTAEPFPDDNVFGVQLRLSHGDVCWPLAPYRSATLLLRCAPNAPLRPTIVAALMEQPGEPCAFVVGPFDSPAFCPVGMYDDSSDTAGWIAVICLTLPLLLYFVVGSLGAWEEGWGREVESVFSCP